MDDELFESIHAYAKMRQDLRVLDEQESESIRSRVESAFGVPNGSKWPWERLSAPRTVQDYGEANPFREILRRVGGATRICIFITDDESPPWMAIEGSAELIVQMVGEQRFFEYFLVPCASGCPKWAIFDNHHNQLVFVGDSTACQ